MNDSPESVARRFLAALEDFANVDNIVSFFADDAVYIDPMRGVQRGIDELRSELSAQAVMGFNNVKIEIDSIVADGGTVMLERHDSWTVRGEPYSIGVIAVIEVAPNGRVVRWRDSYDSKPLIDQLTAAGYQVPT